MKNPICLFFVLGCLVLFAVSADAVKAAPSVKTSAAAVPSLVTKPLPPGPPVSAAKVKIIPIEVGFGGGAAMVDVGYLFPLSGRPLTLKIGAGLALGNAYNILLVQGQAEYAINPEYFGGLSLDWANYSESVANIPGISGTIAKGANTGAGFFFGKTMDKYFAKIGYSSVLGLTTSIGTKF